MRKPNNKYFFSVEGETEHWYFKWLQDAVNAETSAACTVTIDAPVEKDPMKRAKRLTELGKTEITHIFDYESNEEVHVKQFRSTLDRMKDAQSQKVGKHIIYRLGYSNFSFELWIVLHKADCNGPLAHRRQYLMPINRAYNEHFENLDQYKHEDNFKRILSKLSLEDVRQAIRRSKVIMQKNKENGFTLQNYKGFSYYGENPALTIWESIEKILKDCRLI